MKDSKRIISRYPRTSVDGDVDGLSLLFVFRARHATNCNSHTVGANVISGDVMNETGVLRVETNAEGKD